MSAATRQPVSWDEVLTMCGRLAGRLQAEAPFDAILAIARGGLVPAAILAQRMGQRHILAASLASYRSGRRERQLRFLEFPEASVLSGRRILVIDDIWDSGRTAVMVRGRLRELGAEPCLAVLHYKPSSSHHRDQQPDLWEVETGDWVVYPWETSA